MVSLRCTIKPMDDSTPKRVVKRAAKKGTPGGLEVPGPVIPGRMHARNAKKQGVAEFFGTWPGDETDAELDALVIEVRSS
jgi:hypothetical protein